VPSLHKRGTGGFKKLKLKGKKAKVLVVAHSEDFVILDYTVLIQSQSVT